MNKQDFKWAPIIPLIGGFPLGAEEALGKPPEFIASYTGFWKNDEHYVNYQNETLGRDIRYLNLDEDREFSQKINIIVGTPPCAALSQLNSSQSEDAKGAGCAKNEWMYQIVYDGVNRFDADAIIIENAPALFTSKGEPVANRLEEIAKEFGRSISFYKTSTHYHGIPQSRDRTFAIIWKLEYAPILDWYRRESKNFGDYLLEVSNDSIQNDIIMNPNVQTEPYYQFVQYKTGLSDVRQEILSVGVRTAHLWVMAKGLLKECVEWFESQGMDKAVKNAQHAEYKYSLGKSIWDSSTHVTGDISHAWVGRNMNHTIHPIEDRSCTIRESLHMMGFPHNFVLVEGLKRYNHIPQNVPTCTARDIVEEAAQALLGKRELSLSKLVKQNNHTKKIELKEESINTLF